AQMLKLPAVNSCTSFAETKMSFDRMLERLADNIPADELQPAWDEYRRLTDRIKQTYDVEIQSPYEVFCNPAPLTIVYTTRKFQPDGEAFDPTYKFVGPSISPRFVREQIDLDAVKEQRPVYISLGTVFNRAVDFYKLCFEAL